MMLDACSPGLDATVELDVPDSTCAHGSITAADVMV
jgi:hypothetical protein